MNATQFMDKQMMDLTQSNSSNNFIDLMNNLPKEVLTEEDEKRGNHIGAGTDKEEILPSYDFLPIRPIGVSSSYSDAAGAAAAAVVRGNAITDSSDRTWSSMEPMAKPPVIRDYSHLDSLVPDKVILEKAQNTNDSVLISEIDWTMKKHTDNLIRSMDGLSTQLVQLENRMSQLENSLDDLKVFVGNGLGSTDGKMRQLENILHEVQGGVQNLKDKQQVMEAQMLVAKLQVPGDQAAPRNLNTTQHVDPVQQVAPQQSSQQFRVALEPSVPGLPLNSPLLPPQLITHPSMPLPNQFPQGQIPSLTKQDTYFQPPNQTHENPHPEYQVPLVLLFKPGPAPVLPASTPAPEHQLVHPPPPLSYAQPSQITQQYPPAAPVNLPPQFQASALGHPEETDYISSQSYPSNLQQTQPNAGPAKPFYPAPPHLYEPNPGRSSSGYIPTAGPSDPYSYSGPAARYETSSSLKPHSHPSGVGSNNAPIPTARLLPQAISTASPVDGGSGSGGTGNRAPIDDVVDKVTNMGFPRDHVRATVKKLTENGQSVDLNAVLDKLMNNGDVQPPRGWFGH